MLAWMAACTAMTEECMSFVGAWRLAWVAIVDDGASLRDDTAMTKQEAFPGLSILLTIRSLRDAAEADEFGFEVFFEPFLGAFAAEAGLLDAAEGCDLVGE